jgi:hypothetical protein
MKQTIIDIPYCPHDGQLQLHNCTSRFRTLVCGRRWGKTIFAINELIKWAMSDKGDYWYVAPTYRQAKLIAWVKLKYYAVAPIVRKINEADLLITFKNGSTIRLLGADNEDSLRGVGLKGVVLDEFADMKEIVWETVIRPMLTDYAGKAIFLGTPKGKINPLYEKFIRDIKYRDDNYLNIEGNHIEVDSNYSSFRFMTSDNPYISAADVEEARRELAPQYFRQEYEASFENYTGIIYKEFNTSKHVIKDIEIKDWWNIYVGMDTGRYSAITFMCMDDNGIAYIFDEIYDYDGIVADISKMIFYKLASHKIDVKRVLFFIDSASQVKAEYKHNKVLAYDANKDVENQIALVRNRFASDRLFIKDTCKMHIIEHQAYIWDEKATKITPKKENDHTCNSTQYIFSTYNTYKAVDTKKIEEYKNTLEWMTINKTKERKVL